MDLNKGYVYNPSCLFAVSVSNASSIVNEPEIIGYSLLVTVQALLTLNAFFEILDFSFSLAKLTKLHNSNHTWIYW